MALSGYGADNAGYAQQANDLQYRYNTDKASNAYGRFLSQQRGTRGLSDMSRDFNQQYPGFKSSFGQRGLAGPGVRSGSMQRSMGSFLGDYNRGYSRLQQDVTGQLQQADLESTQLDAYYNNSLAALEQQKQQEIANAALAIEALRPFLGGA